MMKKSLLSSLFVSAPLLAQTASGRDVSSSEKLATRDNGVNAILLPLAEDIQLKGYYVNVSVGSPPQSVQLQLDTGSSDVWVIAQGANVNLTSPGLPGAPTEFDSSKSTTFSVDRANGFNVSYGDGSGVTGDLFLDNFTVGSVTLSSMQMGLAHTTSTNPGIMGVGFRDNEASAGRSNFEFPNLVDTMVNQSVINSQAYSLWLDDIDVRSGSILFGGIDTAKFSGTLANLAIYPSDGQNASIREFMVSFTSLAVTTASGTTNITAPDFPAQGVVLDSGSTAITLPDAVAGAVYEAIGADWLPALGVAIVPCQIRNVPGNFQFGFGGPNGPTINVPVSEMIYPIKDQNGVVTTIPNTNLQACEVGISPASASGAQGSIFGDTFLRSAYVVYDLANARIGLANTKFNATDSNIVAFPSLNASIPSATSVSNEVPITYAASTASSTTLAQISPAVFTGAAASAFSSAYPSGLAGTGTPKSGKKNAAEGMPSPFAWERVVLMGLTMGFMGVGGLFLL